MAFFVRLREREIGVRRALGAPDRAIHRLVLRRGLALILLGLGTGAALAIALGRVLRGLLAEVNTEEPWVVAAAALLLGLVALATVLVPARRATRIDPLAVLRGE
jgi:putative ABC transport system permease protein